MSNLEQYYKNQSREQRQVIDEQSEIIKALKREEYEVKQSIFRELVEVIKIGQSNDIYKNMKMLAKLETLKNVLYFDIQEYLEEQLEIEQNKELISDRKSEN